MPGQLNRYATSQPPLTGDGFRKALHALRKGCLFLIAAVALIVCINWIVQFLSSPIGWKDLSASTNPLVINAELAFWPLVALFLLLTALEFLSIVAGGKQLLGITVALIIFLTLVESFLGDSLRREFFPGTDFFWNNIWPMVWAAVLLGIDLLTAFVCARAWKAATSWRDKLGTVLLVLSTIPAVIAFAGLVLPNMEDLSINALWALGLYLLGIGLITTRDAKPEPNRPGLRLRGEER